MNVVLVTIDCLRRDQCGLYGHHRDTTPVLDALARRDDAIIFEDAYATGPVTTESFPGILAGRLSADCVAGDTLYQKRIPEGEPTLASHMRDEGYSTTAVISNPRIGEHVASDRGFETFRNLRNSPGEESADDADSDSGGLLPDLRIGSRLYDLRERMREFEEPPLRYELPFLGLRTYQYLSGWPSVRGERVIDEFLESLSETESPFFGWTHLMDVHGPIHPESASRGDDVGGLLAQFRSQARRVSNTPDARTEYRYDGAVSYVDEQLGRIVDWLRAQGLWDETALIVTADHGDALMDRGMYGHPQHYMYDELLSVPLVARVPGRNGFTAEYPFSLGWIHELITETTATTDLDAPLSSSYEQHLGDKSVDSKSGELLFADSISGRGHSVTIRQGNLKYHSPIDDDTNHDFTVQGIVDTERDPKERNPLEGDDAGLRKHAQDMAIRPEAIEREKKIGGEVDSETKDRLKQLGYAE